MCVYVCVVCVCNVQLQLRSCSDFQLASYSSVGPDLCMVWYHFEFIPQGIEIIITTHKSSTPDTVYASDGQQ